MQKKSTLLQNIRLALLPNRSSVEGIIEKELNSNDAEEMIHPSIMTTLMSASTVPIIVGPYEDFKNMYVRQHTIEVMIEGKVRKIEIPYTIKESLQLFKKGTKVLMKKINRGLFGIDYEFTSLAT